MEYEMSIREARCKFSLMFAQLIVWINQQEGYETAINDVKAHDGHMKNSLHYMGLAGDINLYKYGKWCRKTEDHTFAGEYWESIGGSWGGRFGDGNHYSLAYGGRK